MNIKELSVLSTVKLTLKDNQNKDIVLRGMFSKLTKENKHDFYGLVNRNIKKFEVIFVQKNGHQGINENKIYIKLENINRSKLPKQESEILKQVIIRNKLREVPDNLGNTLSNDSIYFDKVKKELSSKEGLGKIKTNIVLAEHLIIPDEINGIPVEHLDSNSFNRFHFKKIKLGNNLIKLPDFCFKNSELTELFIPKRIESLGRSCFYNSSLKNLIFENDSNLKCIYHGCFFNSQLTELTIPRNVEYLLNFCFYEALIEKLMFENNNNLRRISSSSFYKSKLTELNVPENIENIGAYCFKNSPLKTIIFNNKDIKLDVDCFFRANLLKKPEINQKGLKDIFNNSPFVLNE